MRLIVDWTVGEYESHTYVEPYEFESPETLFVLVEENKLIWEERRKQKLALNEKYRGNPAKTIDEVCRRNDEYDAIDAVIIIDDKGREFWLDNMRDENGWVELNIYTVDEWFGD